VLPEVVDGELVRTLQVIQHQLPERVRPKQARQRQDDLAFDPLVGAVDLGQAPLVQELLPLALEVHEGLVEGPVHGPAEGLEVPEELFGGRLGEVAGAGSPGLQGGSQGRVPRCPAAGLDLAVLLHHGP
jgi:hypothetical protein